MSKMLPEYHGKHRTGDKAARSSYRPRHAALEVPPAVAEWRVEQGQAPIEATR
jgi:hypothetical protein